MHAQTNWHPGNVETRTFLLTVSLATTESLLWFLAARSMDLWNVTVPGLPSLGRGVGLFSEFHGSGISTKMVSNVLFSFWGHGMIISEMLKE